MTNRQCRRRSVTAQSAWEKSAGEHRRGLRVQEPPPRRVSAPRRRRRDPQRLEDPANRGRTGSVTEPQQLTLDPLIPPAVVPGGEPPGQRGDLGADRRPACLVRCHRRTVPGGDQPARPQPSRQEPDQDGGDRPAGPVQPGPGMGTAQHGGLVPQHQQFRVLGRRRTTRQDQPAADPDEDQAEQAKGHRQPSWLTADLDTSPQLTGQADFWHPQANSQVSYLCTLLEPHRVSEPGGRGVSASA